MPEYHNRYFPPSSADRWINCPGSVLRVAALPDERGHTEYTAEGTAAHTLFEQMLTEDVKKPQTVVGMDIHVEGWGHVTVDDEMEQACLRCVRYVHDTVGGGASIWAERRVPCVPQWTKADDRLFADGTADCIAHQPIDEGVLHVFDLKYGKGVKVEAKGNFQMMLYAAGALNEMDMILGGVVDEITVHVLQPRLDHFDSFTVTVKELEGWIDSVVRPSMVEALGDKNARLKITEKGCQWCPVKGDCEAQHVLVRNGFADVINAEDAVAMGDTVPGATLAQLFDDWPMIEKAMKAFRTEAVQRLLEDPDAVPGYKVVEGRSNRVWEDAAKAEEEIYRLGGEPFLAPRLKSPAQAEADVGKGSLDAFTVKPPGAPTLVPETDKRPVYQPATFTDEEDSDE